VHREEGITDVPPAGIEAAFALAVYYQDMVTERRKRPTDDLTSAVMAAEVDGQRLTDDEVMAFLILMVVAGNETTTKLLGNCWYWGWRHPDERAKPLTDPTRIPDWVEETLRYDTSSHMLARITLSDVEVHDQIIPAGSRVLLLAGSANRDHRVFSEPDRYDLERDNTQTASFGMGRHFCLGAALARLEGRIAVEELTRRYPGLTLAGAPVRRPLLVLRGFESVPVRVR